MAFAILNTMSTQDKSQIEAARDPGASGWRAHRRVAIPLARPGIAAGCIATFAPAAGAFSVPRIISRNGSVRRSTTSSSNRRSRTSARPVPSHLSPSTWSSTACSGGRPGRGFRMSRAAGRLKRHSHAYAWMFLIFVFAPPIVMVGGCFNDAVPPSDPALRRPDRDRFFGCLGNSAAAAAGADDRHRALPSGLAGRLVCVGSCRAP